MTRNQMLAKLHELTDSLNLKEPELLDCINRAVDDYSKRQAAKKDIRLIKTTFVNENNQLPDDYLEFYGIVPVAVNGNYENYYNPIAPMDKKPIRYLARLPYVTDYGENDQLPYDDEQSEAIIEIAKTYALKNNKRR